MSPSIVAATMFNGLAAGAVYALVAISFGIVYRTTRVFNFAQGDFGALGAYVALTAGTTLALPAWTGLIVGPVAVGIFAAIFERIALRRLYQYGEVFTFISTIGLGFVIRGGIQLIWGPEIQTLGSPFPGQNGTIFGIRASSVWLLCIAILVAGFLYLFLRSSKPGRAMRACSQDRRASSLLGIPVNRMYNLALVLSGAVGGFAGVLIGPSTYLQPTMGITLGIPGFIAALIGGLGSMPGAVAGGLFLGLVQAASVLFLPPQISPFAVYVVFVLVLVARPSGFFSDESLVGRRV
jgi:branched-chain amino acid transport system permease protein